MSNREIKSNMEGVPVDGGAETEKRGFLGRIKDFFGSGVGDKKEAVVEATESVEKGETAIGDVAELASSAVQKNAGDTVKGLETQIAVIEKETPQDPILEKLKALVAEEDSMAMEAQTDITFGRDGDKSKETFSSLREALEKLMPNSQKMDKEMVDAWREKYKILPYDFSGGQVYTSGSEIRIMFIDKKGGISEISIDRAQVEGLKDASIDRIESDLQRLGLEKYKGKVSLYGALQEFEDQKEGVRRQKRWEDFSQNKEVKEDESGQFRNLREYLMAVKRNQIVPPDRVKSHIRKGHRIQLGFNEKTGSLTFYDGKFKLQYIDNTGGVSELFIDASKIKGLENVSVQSLSSKLRYALGIELPDGTEHPSDSDIEGIVAEEKYRQYEAEQARKQGDKLF